MKGEKIVKKRWLSIFLILALALTMVSWEVFAAGEQAVTILGQNGEEKGEYPDLVQAAEAADDGDTLVLNQNVTNTAVIEVDKTLTLDGNHHTVAAVDKAFDMFRVTTEGTLTVRNVTLDGSSTENRSFSDIINIEGGKVYIEEGAILTNNRTAAVGIGTNVPGGVCVMNGGKITGNLNPAGSNSTGAAVTVLEGSTFIMNGGEISHNETLKYGTAGIMVTRGGTAYLNGGVIEENTALIAGMGAAVTIHGGRVEFNGTTIRNNTSANGYGAVYVRDASSFGTRWSGIAVITGGEFYGNKDEDGTPNAFYLWSSSETGAYLSFQGSPKIQGASRIYANGGTNAYPDFLPLRVEGAFTPQIPVELDVKYGYLIGQTMVEYDTDIPADSSHFVAAQEGYGFQKDEENNLLYTEEMVKVNFRDGDQVLDSRWSFVEDTVSQPDEDDFVKEGYELVGWYQDASLTQPWDFSSDTPGRGSGTLDLYAKWKALPPEAPEGSLVENLLKENAVTIDCTNGEVEHDSVTYGLKEGYIIGQVYGDEDTGYKVDISVPAAPYVKQHNTDTGAAHTLFPEDQQTQIITLEYVGDAWQVGQGEAPVTYTVLCETPAPQPPTAPEGSLVENLLKENAVTIDCTNGEVEHDSVTYELKEGYIIGQVYGDEDTGYKVDISVPAEPYVKQHNTDTGAAHVLSPEDQPAQIITLEYVGDAWQVGQGEAPMTYTVLCETEMPEEPGGGEEEHPSIPPADRPGGGDWDWPSASTGGQQEDAGKLPPQTGDAANVAGALLLLAVSGGLLAFLGKRH